MHASRTTVAIVGAGTAGVSAAIALRLRGFAVEVFERRPSPTTMGAGIVCWPNASFVSDALGVLDAVRSVAGRPTCMRRTSRRGESLGELDITRLDRLTGWPSLSVLRTDLQRVLLNRLSELGVEVQYDRALVSLQNIASGRVRLELSGAPACEPDIVLGAEGRMRSVARAYVMKDARPEYQGFVNWLGVVETPKPVFSDMAITDVWGVGERFGIVPVSPTRAYWAGAAAQPECVRSPAVTRGELLETTFRGWPTPVAHVLAASRTNPIHELHVHDHNPAETWHRDNVLLVGDAAHAALPTSGQGACQALEDAWQLSATFAEMATTADRGAIDEAFIRFTETRKSKTARITQLGRRLAAKLFETDPKQCALRDEESRSTDFEAMVLGMARGWWQGLPVASASLTSPRN